MTLSDLSELSAQAEPEVDPGMHVELSAAQVAARRQFRDFVAQRITPFADQWDRQEQIPRDTIDALRSQGYLGALLPRDVGGGAMDAITYGLLTEELARGCSSVRSLLTVHDMAAITVARWGGPRLKAEILPALASGKTLGALAVSEPGVGSDAASVETEARFEGEEIVLNGHKKWTTFGQIADVFLVLARSQQGLGAFLVNADAPGFSRRAIQGMTGTRASMLAELELDDCRVPADHQLGRVGFGLSHVIGGTALDHGRYSVAWGSVGIAQACLDACLDHTAERQQGGKAIRDHQLVRRQLTEMITETRAARLLCYRAGHLRRKRDPGAAPETWVAKYFASRAAVRAANCAVQLHGAIGLHEGSPVGRYLRDAKVMEVIEGSSQIQQTFIPDFPLSEL